MAGMLGGGMNNIASNPAIWPNPYGASATGLPYSPGQVTAEDLQAGAINRVIGISVVDLETYAIFSWPANPSDG
jgi:hypothetical protein